MKSTSSAARSAKDVIRTTDNHPFYVKGKGWVHASDLKPGDLLRDHTGRYVRVRKTVDSGKTEPVFNLHVAGHHTYFVVLPQSGQSVLVHNASFLASALAFIAESSVPGIGSLLSTAGLILSGSSSSGGGDPLANALDDFGNKAAANPTLLGQGILSGLQGPVVTWAHENLGTPNLFYDEYATELGNKLVNGTSKFNSDMTQYFEHDLWEHPISATVGLYLGFEKSIADFVIGIETLPATLDDLGVSIGSSVLGKLTGMSYQQEQNLSSFGHTALNYVDPEHWERNALQWGENKMFGGAVELATQLGGNRDVIQRGMTAGHIVGDVAIQVALFFIPGAGEAGALAEGTQAARLVGEVGEAGRALELTGEIGNASRAGEFIDMVPTVDAAGREVWQMAEETQGLARAAQEPAGLLPAAQEPFGLLPAPPPPLEAPLNILPSSAGPPMIVPGSLPAQLEQNLLQTLQHIDQGTIPTGPIAKKWGTPYMNLPPLSGDLPLPGPVGLPKNLTPFREYRVAPPPGTPGPAAGPFRIVVNPQTGEVYFTWTHYGDFDPITGQLGTPAFVTIRGGK